MPLVAALTRWPAVAVAFGLYGYAFYKTDAWCALLGALLAVPFCLEISAYPIFQVAGFAALGGNFLSAFVLRRGRRDIAFAALVPLMIISTALAVFGVRGIELVRP